MMKADNMKIEKGLIDMKTIGITGGVGTGKSQILSYLEKQYNCKVLKADEIAHRLKEIGEECYQPLILLLGEKILNEDGKIDNSKMAECIFKDRELLKQVNRILHPAVKKFIQKEIALERMKEEIDYFFVEAALLIEDEYTKVLDDIWYIYAEDSVRRKRLIKRRGYTEDRINSITSKQLSEAEYRKHCITVIDNSNSLEATYLQIRMILEEYI